jgi:hypothetical protein
VQLNHTYRVPFLNSNWPGNSVPSENVISRWQWKQMKKLIVQHAALSRMGFNDPWPAMLDGYAEQPNLILLVVGIAPSFSVGTSGCDSERLISLLERPQDQLPRENGTRDPARSGLMIHSLEVPAA